MAFAGRSNVGKSSLINALVGQRGLARTSNTPGRTQELNFFEAARASRSILVDMPGYGFAKAPKDKVEAWTRLVKDYLRGRPTLLRVFLLIDCAPRPQGRRPADPMELLDEAAVSYQVRADQDRQDQAAAAWPRCMAATAGGAGRRTRPPMRRCSPPRRRRAAASSELRAEIATLAAAHGVAGLTPHRGRSNR